MKVKRTLVKEGQNKHKDWDIESIKYLVNNYEKKTIQDISEYLGRTHDSVKSKAKRIGLLKGSRENPVLNDYKTDKKGSYLIITTSKNEQYQIKLDTKDLNKVKQHHWSITITDEDINIYTRIEGNSTRLQRFLMGIKDEGLVVIFKNKDKYDFTKSNLKVIDRAAAQLLRTKANKTSLSGCKNVTQACKADGTKFYRVEFKINGKSRYYGQYTSLREAKLTADTVREKLAKGILKDD